MSYYWDSVLIRRARSLRKNMTKAKTILWSRIRSRKINGYKFRRQQPLMDYIVDFYCDDLKLIVEVDGEILSLPETISHDLKRDNILKSNGYNIIRLMNSEIETDTKSSLARITSFIVDNLSLHHGDNRGAYNA